MSCVSCGRFRRRRRRVSCLWSCREREGEKVTSHRPAALINKREKKGTFCLLTRGIPPVSSSRIRKFQSYKNTSLSLSALFSSVQKKWGLAIVTLYRNGRKTLCVQGEANGVIPGERDPYIEGSWNKHCLNSRHGGSLSPIKRLGITHAQTRIQPRCELGDMPIVIIP